MIRSFGRITTAEGKRSPWRSSVPGRIAALAQGVAGFSRYDPLDNDPIKTGERK